MKYDNLCVIIPSLDPNQKLVDLVENLQDRQFNKIMIVDDGSANKNAWVFKETEDLGAMVIHHSKNMGKGVALRDGFRACDTFYGACDGYITADCDGQHTAEDIEKVAMELEENPDHFVLGCRKFANEEGGKVAYWVNYYQRMFFRVTNARIECPDPRSGLRGIPASMKDLALHTEGRSYDYEMNFLDEAMRTTTYSLVPISTPTLTSDPTSHFRPVYDLLGLYKKFWRYLITSNMATVVDLILFSILEILLASLGKLTIFVSTVGARIVSGFVGYELNRHISFKSRKAVGMEMVRYSIVFVGQMVTSGIVVTILHIIPIPTVIIKAVVDFVLFFVSYNLQKNWVFGS